MCISLAQTVLHNCSARVTSNENKRSQTAIGSGADPVFFISGFHTVIIPPDLAM